MRLSHRHLKSNTYRSELSTSLLTCLRTSKLPSVKIATLPIYPVTSAETWSGSHPVSIPVDSSSLIPVKSILSTPLSLPHTRLYTPVPSHVWRSSGWLSQTPRWWLHTSAGCCHRILFEQVIWSSSYCLGLKIKLLHFDTPPIPQKNKRGKLWCNTATTNVTILLWLANWQRRNIFDGLLMSWNIYLPLILKETWLNLGNGVIPEFSKLFIHFASPTLSREFSLHFKMFTFSSWTWRRELHFNK